MLQDISTDATVTVGQPTSLLEEIDRLRLRAERAEAAVAEMREHAWRPALVAENVPASIFQRVLHPDGRLVYTYVSGGLHETIGLRPEALYRDAELLFQSIHPDDREMFRAAIMASARDLTPLDTEQRNVKPNGDVVWCRSIARPWRRPDGAVVWDGLTVDITDKKLAAVALRESETRFRGLAEVSFDAILVVEDGVIVAVNGRATRLLGYAEADMIGQPVRKIIPPDYEEFIRQHVGAGFEGVYESAILNRDGITVPVEVSTKNFSIEERRVRVAALRDLTERKQTEAALRESEDRYRRLVELTPHGIFVSDGRMVLYANKAAAEIFGAADPARLVGVEISSLIHHTHAEDAARRIRQVLVDGVSVQVTGRHYRRLDGGEFIADASASPIMWRGKAAVLGVVSDTTARRRSETALRESEERYRKLVELCPLGILVHDGERLLFVNEAAKVMLGAPSSAHLVGAPWWQLIHPDERETALRRNRQVLAGTAKMPFAERRRLRLDGTELITDTAITAIAWEGRPAILGVFRDASERREAEIVRREAAVIQERQLEELKRTKERLERQSAALEQTAADLQRLRDKADKANEAKSKFLATASHELRQPLQALNLLTYSLATTAGDPETLAIASEMKRALSATEQLLSALLDINRLEAGAFKPEIENFSLATLFERLGVEFVGQARDKGLGLRVVPTRVIVRSDFELLTSIVRNFLSNAIKYTRPGQVLLGARRRGATMTIEVWDTGLGIPADQQTRIFEEFFQLETGGRQGDGIGLGLTIVERTAKLLGHPIGMRSEMGSGSVFWVEVPLARYRPRRQRPVRRAVTSLPAGISVLVIDDHPDVLAATVRMLRGWRISVDATDDHELALARLRAGSRLPDLVLADHRLAGEVSGITVLDEIRRIAGRPIPSIVITGDTSATRMRTIESAGYPFLHKPIDPERLRAMIPALLASAAR